MKIKILAFGIAREICDARSFELEVPDQCDTAMLKRHLYEQYPLLSLLESCVVAVNEEYAEDDKIIRAGDEIAIIPPVSGG